MFWISYIYMQVVEIYTVTGQVRVRKHFGKAKILIKEEVNNQP